MPRRTFPLCLLALLCGAAAAQDGPHGKGHGTPAQSHGTTDAESGAGHHAAPPRTGKGEAAAPIHRPQLRLSGDDALAFVQAPHQQRMREEHGTDGKHEGPHRPAGAGRYVCAVVACADAGIDACATLGLDAADVLLIQNAGANADADTAELVARAREQHGLSLVLVLAHDACASLGDGATKPRGSDADATSQHARVEQRAASARLLAARLRISLAHAHALRQRERLEAALRDQPTAHASCQAAGEPSMAPMRVVAATVDTATKRVTWRTQRQDSLPIAPVR